MDTQLDAVIVAIRALKPGYEVGISRSSEPDGVPMLILRQKGGTSYVYNVDMTGSELLGYDLEAYLRVFKDSLYELAAAVENMKHAVKEINKGTVPAS